MSRRREPTLHVLRHLSASQPRFLHHANATPCPDTAACGGGATSSSPFRRHRAILCLWHASSTYPICAAAPRRIVSVVDSASKPPSAAKHAAYHTARALNKISMPIQLPHAHMYHNRELPSPHAYHIHPCTPHLNAPIHTCAPSAHLPTQLRPCMPSPVPVRTSHARSPARSCARVAQSLTRYPRMRAPSRPPAYGPPQPCPLARPTPQRVPRLRPSST